MWSANLKLDLQLFLFIINKNNFAGPRSKRAVYLLNFKALKPEQKDKHFANDILYWIFQNTNVCILFQIPRN